MISRTSRVFIRSDTTKCFPGTMPQLKSYPDYVAPDGYPATICLGSLRKWIVCKKRHFVSTLILRGTSIALLKRIEPLKQKPTNFLFVFNVGKSGDGNVHLGSDQQHGHRCLSSCAPLYLLQRCGSVCGVVVMIVAAIACLAIDFFRQLTKKMDHGPQCSTFLSDPTKYSKYLRLVLISWFGAKSVSLSNVLPSFDANMEIPIKQSLK